MIVKSQIQRSRNIYQLGLYTTATKLSKKYQKICEFCNKEFECDFRPTRIKYCSEYCRDRKSLTSPERKEYEKQYREKNKERIHKTQKECYEKNKLYYIQKSKEFIKNNPNTRLQRFKILDYKTKKIRFQFDIRCGVCNLCRAVEKIDTYSTQRHHDNDVYFDEDPLKNTLELCVNCHGIETFKVNHNKNNVQKNNNEKKE